MIQVQAEIDLRGRGDDADAATAALKAIDSAAKAVIAEASKVKGSADMDATADCLKKLDTKGEQSWVDEHVEDGMFSDPEVYHSYLITALKRLRSAGEMNFGFVLGKKAEEHRIALHKSKSSKALASMLAKETGLHAMTWGSAAPDPDEGAGTMLVAGGNRSLHSNRMTISFAADDSRNGVRRRLPGAWPWWTPRAASDRRPRTRRRSPGQARARRRRPSSTPPAS